MAGVQSAISAAASCTDGGGMVPLQLSLLLLLLLLLLLSTATGGGGAWARTWCKSPAWWDSPSATTVNE